MLPNVLPDDVKEMYLKKIELDSLAYQRLYYGLCLLTHTFD